MLNVRGVLEPVGQVAEKKAHAVKLLQIAALVAMLMALGSASVEAAEILCVTTENDGGCGEQVGSYIGNGEEQSNIWKFFEDGSFETLIYTLEISGSPLTTFDLQVLDRVVTQEELSTAFEGDPPLVNFPNAECIPTFDEDGCGLFDVFAEGESPTWTVLGYLLQITWFSNDNPLSAPPDDGNNTILKAPDYFFFTEALREIDYEEEPVPDDGTISGRGDGFSTHGAFRLSEPVPEPASLILVGTGLTGLLYRSRRKRRRG
jgi:hypothetical protein